MFLFNIINKEYGTPFAYKRYKYTNQGFKIMSIKPGSQISQFDPRTQSNADDSKWLDNADELFAYFGFEEKEGAPKS